MFKKQKQKQKQNKKKKESTAFAENSSGPFTNFSKQLGYDRWPVVCEIYLQYDTVI